MSFFDNFVKKKREIIEGYSSRSKEANNLVIVLSRGDSCSRYSNFQVIDTLFNGIIDSNGKIYLKLLTEFIFRNIWKIDISGNPKLQNDYKKANDLFHSNKYKESKKILISLLNIEVESPSCWNVLGLIYMNDWIDVVERDRTQIKIPDNLIKSRFMFEIAAMMPSQMPALNNLELCLKNIRGYRIKDFYANLSLDLL
jgi:hypothetical protein